MIEIRRIREEEAPSLRALYRELVYDDAEEHPEDSVGISERGLDNMQEHFRLAATHADVFCLVASNGDAIVGFADAHVKGSATLPGLVGTIENVWVRAEVRGSDVARRLAEGTISQLRGLGAGTILHYADIRYPEPLFEELGFERDVARYSLYA